ncbi:hypothetical protein MMPV_008665 [Pyropia vietnamensis]
MARRPIIMAPPPSSAFVPPVVPPARLPGGTAAPTVVPASAFTSGSGAAVTAASGSVAGDRKTAATPSRGRSRRKTVASAGQPSSLSRGGASGGSTGGSDAAGGTGDKTLTVVRAPTNRAPANRAPSGGDASKAEQAPTAAAVADVLSALVSLLSPAATPEATFETDATSAAKMPPQPVTLAQLMSPTPAQSPLEAAAAMLASTAAASPSGKAAMEVPKLATASRSTRAAPAEATPKKPAPPKEFTLSEMLAPTPGQSPLEAAAALLAAAAEAAPSGKSAMDVPSSVKPLMSPPVGDSPLDVAAAKLAAAAEPETSSTDAPSDATFLVPCTGPTAVPTLSEVLDAPPAQTPLQAAAAKLQLSAEQAPSGKAAFEKPPHMRDLMTPAPGESPLEWTARRLEAGEVGHHMYSTAQTVTEAPVQKKVVTPSKIVPAAQPLSGSSGMPTMSELLAPPAADTPLEAAAARLGQLADRAVSGMAATEHPTHMEALMNPEPSMDSPLEQAARALFPATPPVVGTSPSTAAVIVPCTGPSPMPTLAEVLNPPAADTPLEKAAALLALSAQMDPSGKAAMASPAQSVAFLRPKPSMDSPLEQTANALFPTPVEEEVKKPETVENLLAPPVADSPLEAAAVVLQRSAELHPSGKAAMGSPAYMQELMHPKPSMESPLEQIAEAMYTAPVVEKPVAKPSGPAPMPTMEQLLSPPPARTPLEAAASVLQRSAELHPSGKAAMGSPAYMQELMHPKPSMESPLERTAEAMYTAPVVEKPVAKPSGPAPMPTMEQLLSPPPARTPLEAAATVLQRSAELHPSGKAAMASPAHMQELMHPKPSMESPLERTAEAMFPTPVVDEPVVEEEEELVIAPKMRTPLEASAALVERSALLDPSGKAAMAPPTDMAALLHPEPSMESPLERIAEAMYIAPTVPTRPIKQTVQPKERTPLQASAAVLERSALLDPSGKAAMAPPTDMAALLHPTPSMDSPLERTAAALFPPPAVDEALVTEKAEQVCPPTMEQLLSPPVASSPLEAAASVLQRSAELHPSGKAAMGSPAYMQELMHPKPSMESPLERTAEAMYTAPVVEKPVAKPSGPAPMPTMEQLLSPPPARTPLEAAASVLQRSAELHPSGKAAMGSPAYMQELMHPKPSMESPLERTAEAMYTAPVVEKPVAKPSGPAPMPTMEQLLSPPPARTPLEAAASVLQRSAELHPSGKAAMGSPAYMQELMHPKPSMESPLERTAEAMYTAPVVEKPVAKPSGPAPMPTMEQLLSPPPARTPLEAAASVLQRSAELHPSGKAAMASPAQMDKLMHPKPSMESPLERTAEAMYTAPVVEKPVAKPSGPAPMPTMEQLLSPPPARTPLEAAASVLQRSAELHPSGKAAMASPARMQELMHPKPSMESPLERTAEAMYTAPEVETPMPLEAAPSTAPTSVKELLAAAPARTPLEAAASVLQRSAELHPSGKAAMASPVHMQELMHPKPSMESPLERTAEAMYTAPVVKTRKAKSLAVPERSPLDAAAMMLQHSAELTPSGMAATAAPTTLADLLHPEPSMDSPLEQVAKRLIPPTPAPDVEVPAPVVSEPTPSAGPTPVPTLAEFLNSPPAPSPVDFCAAALERSAMLDPSGKAAMAPPPHLSALLRPEPNAGSPLERMAEAMFPAPEVKASARSKSAKQVTLSPVDAAASVLQRSAELDPSGKAAMVSPMSMAALLHPEASKDSPLERAAQTLIPATPAADAPSSAGSVLLPSSGPTSTPTLSEFLDSRPAPSPLEAAASLLAKSAEDAPTGKAAMEEPPCLRALLSPPPAESPLEVEAWRLSGAPRPPSQATPPAALPDFLTAAMTGKAQPSRSPKASTEEDKDRKEIATPGWQSSVPPAGAAAFIFMALAGIYLAMSQGVAAVIAAVLPNK